MTITLTASASCLRCDWTASGDWADVDRGAEKHARSTGHPTMTSAKPAAAEALATEEKP